LLNSEEFCRSVNRLTAYGIPGKKNVNHYMLSALTEGKDNFSGLTVSGK